MKIHHRLYNWLDTSFIGGHFTVGPVTVYGRNAMHFAVNVQLRESYLCFRLPLYCYGKWWPMYCYVSPNATPWAATKWFWGKETRGYG